jgi:peptidoglycan/xylan/chitin deacetylase (PgdA/CDA1 family)
MREKFFLTGIKKKIKSLLYPTLLRLGIYDRIIEKYHRNKIVILWCHRVTPAIYKKPDSMPPLNFETGVTCQRFEELMRFLGEKMRPVSLQEIADFVAGNKEIPDRAVAVMLDDGYVDNYFHAFPILKRYHVPATIFLTTGFIGTNLMFWWDRIGEILKRTHSGSLEMGEIKYFLAGAGESLPNEFYLDTYSSRNRAWASLTAALRRCEPEQTAKVIQHMEDHLEVKAETYRHLHRMLNWEQIFEMSKNGIDFGAHTVSHPFLSDLTPEDFENETLGSKKAVEGKIQKPVIAFAYPFGGLPRSTSFMKEKLKEYGFRCAFLTEEGYVCAESDPYELKRISIGNVPLGNVVRELTTVFTENNY